MTELTKNTIFGGQIEAYATLRGER